MPPASDASLDFPTQVSDLAAPLNVAYQRKSVARKAELEQAAARRIASTAGSSVTKASASTAPTDSELLEVELGAKVSADSSTKYKKRSNARNGPFSTYSRLSTCLAAAWRRPGRILKDVRAERPKFVHHLQTISAAASGLLCMVMLVWGLQSQGVMPDTADLFGTVAKYDFTYPEMHRTVNESLVMDTLEAKAEASEAAELLLSRLVRSVDVVKEQNQTETAAMETHEAAEDFAVSELDPEADVCVDKHEKCAAWAELGECQANPVYMLGSVETGREGSCLASCNACGQRRVKQLPEADEALLVDKAVTASFGQPVEQEATFAEEKESAPSEHVSAPEEAVGQEAASIEEQHVLEDNISAPEEDAAAVPLEEVAVRGEVEAPLVHQQVAPVEEQTVAADAAPTGGAPEVSDEVQSVASAPVSAPLEAAEVVRTRDCVDKFPQCGEWAAAGECQNNPIFMLGSVEKGEEGRCLVSCNACERVPACIDNHAECPEWAARGECEGIGRAYMVGNGVDSAGHCQLSCNVCPLSAAL